MSADPFSILFGGHGSWPEPPDTVVLRLLGLDARPACQDDVQHAFRRELKRSHPDVGSYTALPDVNAAVEAAALAEVPELVWARDVLLRKVPRVTAGASAMESPQQPSRCEACGEPVIRRQDKGSPFPTPIPHPHPEPRCRGCAGKRETPARSYLNHRVQRGRWRGFCGWCAKERELERLRQMRLRRRTDRTCNACGATFTPARADASYCSAACRQKAYRRRHGPAGVAGEDPPTPPPGPPGLSSFPSPAPETDDLGGPQ